MTKLELKIPQPGVTFYGNRRLTTVTILDIKVEDGVKEVFFESLKDCDAIEVKIQSDCRCPSVERLYISENVRNISISNNTFPNVNRVNSDSKYFLSGNVLIEHYDVQDIYILKNTFCKKKRREYRPQKCQPYQRLCFCKLLFWQCHKCFRTNSLRL